MARNLGRRKRVMERSMRIGHCICDPRQSCPCDMLKERDICPCAGERPEPSAGPVRLTQLVEKAGCASKIDLLTLKRAVEGLPFPDDPRVILGATAGDDAGVYRLDDGRSLVQTVDVFSPSVDDPYVFGQVAAANSVSDVYAMGGVPMTALSIIGFPGNTMDPGIMREILRGGLEKMAEAGVAVIGGHSIQDNEIKAGFAVTGLIETDAVVARGRAAPGDRLILTKPIGTGIVSFAAQIGRASEGAVGAAIRSMVALNKRPSELMVEHGASACTDVTGFSLLGHLMEMARDSGVDAEIAWDDVPLLPDVVEYAAQGIVPGATERNREACEDRVRAAPDLDPIALDVCFDPQTSGGLLIAVAEERADALLRALVESGVTGAAAIGRITGRGSGFVTVSGRGQRPKTTRANAGVRVIAAASSPAEAADGACCAPSRSEACCASGATEKGAGNHGDIAGSIADTERKFKAFLQAAAAPKGLDAHTKQAIALALSVLSKCEPCLAAHIRKARRMGFTQEEIDDAAWSAIAFGGSPVMMFYDGVKERMASESEGA
ncbi:MAG TPA: selenide, water dikinase SelD [Verrucomicrobiae bacterium]|nr:selenide, water dikinase SelD [Verrucomicrobiae bacterium]